ncbi:MAG TPA: glycosyltransferase [Rhodothermales bacterium]|nr:glycosyltransferase [Rhodothermales bacterium]
MNIAQRFTTIPSAPPSFPHAVIVCTRNRPDEVRHLMESLQGQSCTQPFEVVVVDASDDAVTPDVRAAADSALGLTVKYVRYPDTPSLARQRNFGVEQLAESTKFVHFLDDDVTLEPGYLETLADVLEQHPDIGGIGGSVLDARKSRTRNRVRDLVLRFFLVESSTPGKVLSSGGLTSAQSVPLDSRLQVECLGGCATYRRELVAGLRFDDSLEGYSMDEDLDFSYRVGRMARLVVEPAAKLIHHISPTERHSVRESRSDLIVHRYWFVEKNISHPLKKPAFWWRILGSFLMTSLSRNPDAAEARRGIVDGVSIVLKRSHPLLGGP